MTKEELVNCAIEAMDLAYVPYSHFRVGAALLTKTGEVFLGANIENAAYGCTMCGERNAVYNAYMHGVTREEIEALAIVAKCDRPVSPCGQCRQVLSELYPHDKPIYLANTKGEIKETNVDELLPYSFEEDDMNI
jgi:cytidine deaminase